MSGLPTSTVGVSVFILISSCLLQNSARFGNEVGLAYQSPPPLYFNNAIELVGGSGENAMNRLIKPNMLIIKVSRFMTIR